MEFSVKLQGKVSHEAILLRQDSELRLLDLMKRCLMSKLKCDREYAAALSAVATQGLKMDRSDEMFGSLVANAWKTMMEGLEDTGKLMKQNTVNLETKVLDSLNNLYAEKRKIKKFYQEEYTKIQMQLTNISEEVNRKKLEYQKYLEVYKLTRTKFEEYYVKSGRGGRKLDEVRDKYQKACRKLHLTHNEYVLLLCEATEFEKDFRTALLPDLLQHLQNIQEATIFCWKQLLQDITTMSDLTSEKFKKIQNKIDNEQAAIKRNEEYTKFTEKYKTSPIEKLEFAFDASLTEDSAVKFLPNQLTVDNLTIDWLRNKMADLESNIAESEEKRTGLEGSIVKSPIINGISSSVDPEISCRISMAQVHKEREIEELKCSERKMLKQVELIKSALNELGCEEVPSGCDLSLDNQTFKNDSNEQVSITTNKSLVEEEWFHGVLPREEVVRLLVNDGDFLVRETTRNDESQTVLSVCWSGYKHFIVQTTSEGQYRFEGPAFSSIRELILYQCTSGLPVTGRSGAMLIKPIPRERWELNNDDVVLLDKLGRGNFGDVYRAQLKNDKQIYAVKTCRGTLPEDHKKKFLQEARILKQYDHPNIVKFIGICVQKQPIMIVMELVSEGSLLIFLRKHGNNLNESHLMKMCLDVASGMMYLESKNCIHRDLAARNCLIGHNNIVKISDFGMSREEEEYIVSDGMKQIPIKWTAPEALNFGKYTSLCDVWSYGILCWEIFSKGGTPYSGMTNSKARDRIDAGYRMPASPNTPEEMYRLMLRCWEYKPEDRPNFEQVYTVVDTLCKTFG